MTGSETDTPPRRILLHDPRPGEALDRMTCADLAPRNFLDLPDPARFQAQHAALRAELGRHTEVVTLRALLAGDADLAAEAATNPNLVFTRDSAITLPWAPDRFVPGRPLLPSRVREPELAARALGRLGLRPLFAFAGDEYCEGGDVMPVISEGRRTLLVGIGSRTTEAAAGRLARELIPGHLDEVIGLVHDPALLHLDTGLAVLPGKLLLVARGMFRAGFRIDRAGRRPIAPAAYARALGFRTVRVAREDAIHRERCNLLPLGHGRFLAFRMPDDLRAELEAAAGIAITCVDGDEIAKATGGVHCLTRPVYR